GIAIHPSLSALGGGDHRMPARVSVLRGVPVRRAVAAQRDAARLARAQMNPLVFELRAVLALVLLRSLDLRDAADMPASAARHVIASKTRGCKTPRSMGRRPPAYKAPMPSGFRGRLDRAPSFNADCIRPGRPSSPRPGGPSSCLGETGLTGWRGA